MKYFYNNQLEIIDTADKAYLLGLFYSDGYVMYNKASYFASISLIKTDIELLQNINIKFPFFKLETPLNKNIASLRCNQMKFSEHLIKNGVLPNKSSINKNNLRFPNIDKSLYFDFIRGYFDGDGSIYFTSNSLNSKRFSIVSNNYFLIKQMRQILFANNINTGFNYGRGGSSIIRGVKVEFPSLRFELYTNSRKNIEKISKLFYQNNSIALSRKKEIMLKWIDKEKEIIPKCGKCNSNKTKWQMKNKSVFCKKCVKITTIGKVYKQFDKKLLFCNHCNSKNVVNNGDTKSRTDKRIIGFKLLCKDCNKSSSKKF